MDHRVKAAVIGGGPAGIACGITLQKQGVVNCVIDRAVFPRAKTCAGLVTEKTLKELESLLNRDRAELGELFCDFTNRVEAYDRATLLCSAECGIPFHIADRFHFDNALAMRYRDMGGTLLEGQKHYEIDYGGRRIAFKNGDAVQYEYLVFADGALSRAHADFSIKRRSMGFCVEAFLPRERMPVEALQLYIGIVQKGYVWVFPHGDRTCAGLISVHRDGIPYRIIFEDFLRERGVRSENVQMRGAFVPYGRAVPQERLPDNVLMTGDAGGFVDPIYGEGLYMSLHSGRLAGEALAKDAPKRTFLEAMKPCARMISSGKRLQRLVFNAHIQKSVLRKMAGKDSLLKYYCDEQVSQYRYSHMDAGILKDHRRSRAQQGSAPAQNVKP